MKANKKILIKLDRRIRGFESIASGKSSGRGYTKPGSRNPKKR